MTVREIAEEFTRLCREGKGGEKALWSDDVVSIEAMDGPMARIQGREALDAKHEWWESSYEMHDGSIEGPFINGDQFALRFWLDATEKATGKREPMTEMALYTVRNGKVVEERFFY